MTRTRTPRGPWLDVVLVLVAVVYAAYAVYRAPSWAVDDAWIVVRYAEHLAHTGLIRWNLDGPPIEGFTSLLAVVVAAVGAGVHLPPMAVLDAVDVAAFLAGPLVLLGLARSLRLAPGAAGLVAIVHVTAAEHVTHATSGLETELFVTLGLALLWSLAATLRDGERSALPLALLGSLLTVTRPEGIVPAAAALAVVVLARRRSALGPTLRAAACGFVLPQVLLVAWRLATFGVPVPNTFYAKRGAWNLAHHADLVLLFDEHLLDLAAVAIACLIARRVLALPRMRVGPRVGSVCLVATAALGAQWVAYARSLPVMDYARRFAIHDTAWLLVVVTLLVSGAIAGARRLARAPAFVVRALLVVATVAAVLRGRGRVAGEDARTASYARSARELTAPFATWIEANTPAGSTVALYPDAGLVPFATERHSIDFGRLNDAYLAQHARTNRDVVEYFFHAAPDVVLLSQMSPGKLFDEGADAIVADPRFHASYELRLTRDGSDGAAYLLYARRP